MMTSSGSAKSGSATLTPNKIFDTQTPSPIQTQEEISTSFVPERFFTTVLSAAQNAANSLSISIGRNNSESTSRKKTKRSADLREFHTPEVGKAVGKIDPAVKTLGMGDLSLDHLGISGNASGTSLSIGYKHQDAARGRSKTGCDVKNTDLARSSHNVSLPTSDSNPPAVADENPSLFRPRNAYEVVSSGDQTPPNESANERKPSSRRSNSNRSEISFLQKKGGSGNNSSTFIGSSFTPPNNNSIARTSQTAPKITGFAVTSKKRNKDFHQLFRSVPDDDYLIEDYSCALQREILAHGRLYVSEGHLCFSSNILGWITTLVMSFDEIVSIEKRSTALVFKNGLMITTLHAKNVFASFTSRDSTYDLIVGIWKLVHPSLRSSLNGAHITETGGSDKTEKDDVNIPNGSRSDSDISGDIEEDEDEEGGSMYENGQDGTEDYMSVKNAEGNVVESEAFPNVITKKASCAAIANCPPVETVKEFDGSRNTSVDFPGPLIHAPTECLDVDSHYPKVVADDIIPAPLGKVWSLAFGSGSYSWFQTFLTIDQKCFDFTREENAKKPLSLDNRVRNFTYIKPLNGSIGPRQTKCICVETLEFLDFEKYISVTLSTQTPDVPSGSVFCTKTRYCFTWGPNNSTRLRMTYLVEWTGKSWLKGPIEKGAADGQGQYAKDIVVALKNTISSSRSTSSPAIKPKKIRRRDKESKTTDHNTDKASQCKSQLRDWGQSESYHGVFKPLIDILRPLLTGNIMYGVLVGLLVASWLQFGFVKKGNDPLDSRWHGSPERIAAFEEMWRREESELWKWLEDRIGMESIKDISLEEREMNQRLQDETQMQESEIEEAIRTTEERLRTLKKLVESARVSKTVNDIF